MEGRRNGRPRKTIDEVIRKDLEINDLTRDIICNRQLRRRVI